MAVIWYLKDRQWYAAAIDPKAPAGLLFKGEDLHLVAPRRGGPAIVPRADSFPVRYTLVARPQTIRINGHPFLGIGELRHQDEILFSNRLLFFSDQGPVRVALELPEGISGTCPVCGDSLIAPAVRCPQCGTWHHESAALPCWSSLEKCSSCEQPTRMTDEQLWTPLHLEMGEAYGCEQAEAA